LWSAPEDANHDGRQNQARGRPSDIQEALLQTAIYCGVPAAMEAMRTAEAALIALGVIEPRSEQPSQA